MIFREREVGTLRVMDQIRMPVDEAGLSMMNAMFRMTVRSRSFLYVPSSADWEIQLRGEEPNQELVLVAVNPRLGSGDVTMLVGFESDNPDFQPDPVIDGALDETNASFGLGGRTFGVASGASSAEDIFSSIFAGLGGVVAGRSGYRGGAEDVKTFYSRDEIMGYRRDRR